MPQKGTPGGTPYGPDWQLKALIARHRYGNEVVSQSTQLLSEFYKELQERVASGVDLTNWQRDQLQPLTNWTRARLTEVVPKVRGRATQMLADLGAVEQSAHHAQTDRVRTLTGLPSRATVIQAARYKQIINDVDINGVTLGDWWARDGGNAAIRITKTVQSGLLQGMNPREVSRRVISADPNVLTLDRVNRNSVKVVVRTAMTAVSSAAANFEFDEMSDVIDRIRLEAVLDGRTTIVCRALDGTVWLISDPKRPRPPFHLQCRTVEVPEVDLSPLGLPQSALGDRVTMEEWVRDQPNIKQDDMLGPTRAQWFRDRKLTLADLINQDRRPYTLAELSKRIGGPELTPAAPIAPVVVVASNTPLIPHAQFVADTTAALRAATQETAIAVAQATAEVAAQRQVLERYLVQVNNRANTPAQLSALREQARAELAKFEQLRKAQEAAKEQNSHAGRTAISNNVRAVLDDDAQKKQLKYTGAILNPELDPSMRNPNRRAFQAKLDEATDFLDTIFPALSTEAGARPRAFLFRGTRARASSTTIHMAKDSQTHTWVHELVHTFEGHTPKAGEFGVWYRDGRRTSTRSGRLPPYPFPDERFYPGKFLDPYMGKTYGEGSVQQHTEVLTMAIEYLYREPNVMLDKDPALFGHLLDFIRNWRTWTPPTGGP